MGLDYSYLLYFEREHLWETLQGVAGIAKQHHPPVKIHFLGYELSIPLKVWHYEEEELHYDEPEFNFDTVLFFEEDEAIRDYVSSLDRGDEETDRSPPGTDEVNRVTIGYIYLTIYNDLSKLYTQKNPQSTWSCSISEPPGRA